MTKKTEILSYLAAKHAAGVKERWTSHAMDGLDRSGKTWDRTACGAILDSERIDWEGKRPISVPECGNCKAILKRRSKALGRAS
jgi:hypothetical protein